VNVLSSASEETASAVNKIATTIKGVEDNVNESAKVSENVKKDARDLGIKAIEKTIGGMSRIKESVEATGVIINKLGERSQQIGKILTVIDDVTDQTNLLALNAAIIAAQSGEHGRGFAVVANEIKDLAERTSFSTKEISQMIESIQKEVGDAVNAMKDSSKNVIEGMNLSRDANSALNKILNSADKSAQMSKDIEKATTEQAKELHQVNKSVQSITDMVRQIAYATQEQTKGSEQIIGSVEKMRDISRQVRQAITEQTKGSKQINDTVESVNQKVHLIVRATKEQETGSEQIVHSIEQIRDITLLNLDSFTEIKKTIDTLVDQADILKAEVRKFVI
ncbi:MAG: methyl-accepting chemotaxis protein, partial [Thermodesulfovibrionia bacterium]|nr:methyl-accepting chemotaxis protein [Thermodesulfovibrionia bacterium]